MTTTEASLQHDWATWHAAREEELLTPHGWLSLTALHWLDGTAHAYDGLPGRWRATGDGGVELSASGDAVLDGEPVTGTVRMDPVDGQPGVLVEVGPRKIEVIRRTDSYALRVRDPEAITRTAFTGAPAFPVEGRWVVEGRFEPYAQPQRLTVGAVVDGLQHFPTAVGVVRFTIAGTDGSDDTEHALVAFPGKAGGLRLHFRDATSGESTYGGGRSIVVPDPDADGRVRIDFNRTVNLPCAFTAFATCPLPPAENVLPVAVEAGELTPPRPDLVA